MKNKNISKSLFIVFFTVLLTGINNIHSIAQQNEYLCTKGLTYGELLSLFQIPDVDKLKSILSQKCFNKAQKYSFYERRYEKTIGNENHTYEELFFPGTSGAYEYICTEYYQCNSLLKQINDDAMFYGQLTKDKYMYILKNQTHVLEMEDIPDKNVGYAYGFKVRPVTTYDWDRLKAKKLADTFPENANERDNLEYRYARVDALSQSTTVEINAGDKLSFEAGGKITFGAFAGQGGPNGINGFTAYNKINGFRHGSLLYRIGNGNWDYVTNEVKNIRANNAGPLQLIVNDGSPSDNEGLFWVNIKLIRGSTSNTSNSAINNVSTSENNKFVIRNSYKSKVNFELSRDKSEWTSYSLNGLSQSDYWYTDQQQSFFRIKMLTTKVYKIEAGKKYKIDWNKSEWCFDLFSDGDR